MLCVFSYSINLFFLSIKSITEKKVCRIQGDTNFAVANIFQYISIHSCLIQGELIVNNKFIKKKIIKAYLLVLDLGSLGPSTVTLIALVYVATWGGDVEMVIVIEKDFPTNKHFV